MLFSAFWFTFFFVDLFEWIGKKDYVMWVEFVIYFILFGKNHSLQFKRRWMRWCTKSLSDYFFFWCVVYVGNVSGNNVLCTKLERKMKVKVNQEIQ